MGVTTVHSDYTAVTARWRKVRDCVKGETAVKAGRTLYLPKPNPTDASAENDERYEQYLQRAVFLEVTGRTKNGLVGAIFRREPTWELPKRLEPLAENVDATGQSLSQLGKWLCGELCEVGRAGLLVDHPTVPRGLTEAQAAALNARPRVLPYRTEDVINWRYEVRNNVSTLVLVVLTEEENVSTNEFEVDLEKRYRVLSLTDAGYSQRLFNEKGEALALNEAGDTEVFPRRGDGRAWDRIPFFFAGAEDNDGHTIDDAPLYGLATVNIGHYRNSADYEEGVYMHGQGTLFIDIGQMNPDTFKEHNPSGVLIGARRGHVLGQGGKAQLLQMGPNSAAKEAMDAKEQQMVAIGARLITKGGSNQTAEEARITASGESSVLSNLTGNASEAIEAALEAAAQFVGEDPSKVLFQLNQEFFDVGYDPQIAVAKMQELDRRLIAVSDYRSWLRRTGALASERKDEDIDLETEPPPNEGMPNLDDDSEGGGDE
jgi:hypothetical protein